MNSCSYSSRKLSQSASTNFNPDVPPIVIRTAILADIQSLAEVLTDSFHPPQGLMGWMYPLFKLGVCEDLRNRLSSSPSQYICLVASRSVSPAARGNEEIVGTVEMSLRSNSYWSTISSRDPYIANLAVKNSYRRQGVARKLLRKCEQIALEWGFSEISLHVLDNNQQAKQLYFTSGYRLTQMESGLSSWLWNNPRRLLLNKRLEKS